MLLTVFLSTEQESSQMKIKNKKVLSVSIRFWNKKHF